MVCFALLLEENHRKQGKKENISNTSTPYDDAQRTLSVDCPSLLIPLVNEAFQTDYPLDADVKLYNNEFFITTGNDQKRITDSNFSIDGETTTRYHFECQSTEDGSLTLRLFEYGAQIALTLADYSKEESTFIFPHAAVLYLRTENTTPSAIKMRIVTPGGDVSYEIPVVKVQDYGLEEIFEKRLLFLLPYYFLRYQLELLERDADARSELRDTYQDIFQRLSLLEQDGEITEFTRQSLKAMIDKVAMFRASKYASVQKEVEEIMGGKILNYEAKDIRNKALREGREEGISIGKAAGREEGISIGKAAGREEGENLMGKLMRLLVEKGRIEDVTRASTDPEVRQELYKEFHLI